jgi:hypothetical protein
MSRARKTVVAEASADAVDSPTVPAGDPLGWTVEQWLTAAGVPLDKVREELAKQAESRGAVGIPAKLALNIWNQHATSAKLAEAGLLVVQGLVKLSTEGKGPHGHAGAELAG